MVWSGNKAPQQDSDATTLLAQWAEDEFERFSNEQIDNLQAIDLRPIFNAPLRPRQGMFAYADGVKWDPGRGEGPYYYNSNGLWIPFEARPLAATDYYVLTTGSDSNNGLANTAGGAFLTLQKAVDTIAALNISTMNITIHVGAGTYLAGFTINGPWIGTGTVTIVGDVTTPSNVVINAGVADCIVLKNYSTVTVQGFKLIGRFLIACSTYSTLNMSGKFEVGAYSFGGITVTGGSTLNNFTTAVSISGGGTGQFLTSDTNGLFLNQVVSTWTLTANISVTIFAAATLGGYLNVNGLTFTTGGFAVTGQRFTASNRGMINTNGGGATYFPGSIAGTGTNFGAAPWGLYL